MTYHWSIHQLTEYLDIVISEEDEEVAMRAGVEHAAESLGAELGALLGDGEVLNCVGVGRGPLPGDALALAATGAVVTETAAPGHLQTAAARLGGEKAGHLIVGRVDEPFSGEERQLLQGMANVLGLALRSLRTLQAERALRTECEREAAERVRLVESLGQRQRLLESLLTIQRAISHRAPLQVVLDAVTKGAAELLDDAFVALVLTDVTNGQHRMVSTAAVSDDVEVHEALVLDAAAESAELDRVVTCPSKEALSGTALAAPVHIEGVTAGSLVTVTRSRVADIGERREMLAAFAEQASLALTDARTIEAMRDAYHDSLTGLPNRSLFLDNLTTALRRSSLLGTDVTVLFIDLDRFKDVNDSYGHSAGDELLACVAGRIRACLTGVQSAGRLGGDEFAVLLEGTAGHDTGRHVADRITKALLEPMTLGGREVVAFASIGFASSDQTTITADELLRKADVAMYSAKRSGSRRAQLFEPSMHTETMRGLELRSDLSHAVSRGELRLQYQPIVDLTDGTPVAVEALVRWDHPRFGLMSPTDFIPMAEGSGMIVEIGEWVLQRSCEQAAAWRRTAMPDLKVSVNVSPRQLDEPTFPSFVAGVLRRTGLAADALTLEVTESALMGDPERALEQLAPLKAIGVRMAIDDFGTGYSSLAWLQHFPADQLKIDRAFIDTIDTSSGSAAIVCSVLDLARTLQLETVAEGIETLDQWKKLQDMSGNLGQGYLFARPLDVADVVPFFAASAASAAPAASAASAAAWAVPALG